MERFRLDQLRIASPCHERWADMVGDDRVRHCNACDRQVFDLSELTSEQALAVLATRGVTPCVRLRRRADGTVITADCPIGARPRDRRLAVMAGAIAAGAALLAASSVSADPLATPDAADAATTGSIQGVIIDDATHEAMIGATVVVTGPAVVGMLAEITDENGFYAVTGLPPGEYMLTIYYDQVTKERGGVRVEVGAIATANVAMTVTGSPTVISIEDVLMGLPENDFRVELGIPVAAPVEGPASAPHRPTIEWSSWVRAGLGTARDEPAGVARLIGPQADARRSAWELALGADVNVPIALHGELRLGAWAEGRTSSGPVLGAEVRFQFDDQVVVLRAGASAHAATGAIAFGSTGARLVASANRALDDPRDWSAAAGVELDPIGVLRALLGR